MSSPVPKSSIDSRSSIFSSLSRMPGTVVSMSALSVNSKVSLSGGMPRVFVSSSVVSNTVVPGARQRAPTFSDIARSKPSSRHAWSWWSAESMTHSVSGIISSLRSTSGMNAPGMSRPSDGWFQRTRASTPTVSRVARSIFG